MKKSLKVATTVIVDDQKILILKRGPKSSGAGTWNFPGGKVEKDESIVDAAVRETKEETGLELKAEDLEALGVLFINNIVLNIFITDKFSGDLNLNKESSDYKWVNLNELSKVPFVGSGNLHEGIINNIKLFLSRGN